MVKKEQYSVISRLRNIEEMARILREAFERDGEVHHTYITEKLSRAKWDLDGLLNICKEMDNEGDGDEGGDC